jgi:hypothetical protein
LASSTLQWRACGSASAIAVGRSHSSLVECMDFDKTVGDVISKEEIEENTKCYPDFILNKKKILFIPPTC